jgi:hypothetical protein
MTSETFRDLLRKTPFRPFRVVMSSGKTYDVRHPEMALVTRGDLLVGIDEDEGIPATFKMCSMLHITAVEPIAAASAGPEGNGE